jgi:hypothetical protein
MLTRTEILSMPAGDELDVAVLVNVFEMDKREAERRVEAGLSLSSRNLTDAWQVVEKLQEKFPDYDFYIEKSSGHIDFWFRINDTSQGGWNSDGQWDKRVSESDAPTLPLAICRAALLSVLEEKDK